jgi:aspartyl-tRNA(Asn)/glutamyl-tRNA(Gln) amidotransferase subunit A
MSHILDLGLVDLADAIADGSVTSEAATDAALTALDTVGRRLNAVVRLSPDRARQQAREADRRRASGAKLAPLAGVPLAHKDLFFRAGGLSEAGSKILSGHVATETAAVLERLDASGALDIGALHLAEFALSPTGFNGHLGHARNPWSLDHCPGGSSSGSAAVVAARLVPAALGSDTGGSIRHPAAMCGITGLKPTHGLVPLHGTVPLAPSLDCVGPLARSARDVARMMTVIAGSDPRDGATAGAPCRDFETGIARDLRGHTIAVPRAYYREAGDAQVLAAIEASLDAFRDAGATVIETPVPDMAVVNAMFHVLMTVEAATYHRRWLIERPEDYADQVRSRIEPGLLYPATRYAEALMLRGAIAREWLATTMGQADLVHVPVLRHRVPSIAETTTGDPSDVAAAIARVTHCTRGLSYLGLPVIAVPCGLAADLPVAFQLVGRPFTEPTLLRAAHAFQTRTEWHLRKPGLVSVAAPAFS